MATESLKSKSRGGPKTTQQQPIVDSKTEANEYAEKQIMQIDSDGEANRPSEELENQANYPPAPVPPLDDFDIDLDTPPILKSLDPETDPITIGESMEEADAESLEATDPVDKPRKRTGLAAFLAVIFLVTGLGIGSVLFPTTSEKILYQTQKVVTTNIKTVVQTFEDAVVFGERLFTETLFKFIGLVDDPDVSSGTDRNELVKSLGNEESTLQEGQNEVLVKSGGQQQNSAQPTSDVKREQWANLKKKNFPSNLGKSKSYSENIKAPLGKVGTGQRHNQRLITKANKGDADAQYLLGLSKIKGERKQDYEEALNWFKLAAIQRHREAQYNLAVLYEKGLGIEKNDIKALLWYHVAAENEHPEAQFNLATFFLNGRGTAPNQGEAVRWFRRASNHGVNEATQNLSLLSERAANTERKVKQLQKFHTGFGLLTQ